MPGIDPDPSRYAESDKPAKVGWVSRLKVRGASGDFLDELVDSWGRIRLSRVRENFLNERVETREGRNTIVDCYQEWVDCDEYLWFQKINAKTGGVEKEYCRKCSKRGNDVYRWRLDRRLGWIDSLEDKEIFNAKDRNVRGKKTKMLFIVLTFDTKRCSLQEAWENISEEWNRWITAVRKKYGGVKAFKSYEAFKNGYVHVNAVLLFENAEFEISYRDKNKRYRLWRKDKDWFDSLWHSHVDVQACYSTGAFGYVKKYMLKTYGKRNDVKGVSKEQAKLTVALLWLFRKQSFSVSGGLQEVINDLILEKHNSNLILIPEWLDGDSRYKVKLLGVFTLEEIRIKGKPPPDADKKWSFDMPYRRSGEGGVSRTNRQVNVSSYLR